MLECKRCGLLVPDERVHDFKRCPLCLGSVQWNEIEMSADRERDIKRNNELFYNQMA